jgi:TetR/AcrR family transcriptional regulator
VSRTPSPKPLPRRPRDSEATQRALLSAAIAEFAEKGLAGARVEEIAGRAGVNKQLVYHHFGSKDGLYAAALEQVYAGIREQERTLDLAQASPVRAMERLIGFSFDYLRDHPEFVALVADENRAAAQHIRDSATLRSMHSPLVELLRETLARGAEEGVFRPDLDPVDVYISVAALSYFYFSNRHTLSAIFGRDLGEAAAIAARRRHVVSFALAALRL